MEIGTPKIETYKNASTARPRPKLKSLSTPMKDNAKKDHNDKLKLFEQVNSKQLFLVATKQRTPNGEGRGPKGGSQCGSQGPEPAHIAPKGGTHGGSPWPAGERELGTRGKTKQ